MARPSKAAAVISMEKKSHRTKDEMKRRIDAENSLVSGVALRERPEVVANTVAHVEFRRVNKLLKVIGKNDAIYEPVINRYCMLQAECVGFERKREKFYDQLEALGDSDLDSAEKFRLEVQMQKTIIDTDKQVQAKRKMLFDIERENGMTIAAALRSIPKLPDKKGNPLLEALKDDSTE